MQESSKALLSQAVDILKEVTQYAQDKRMLNPQSSDDWLQLILQDSQKTIDAMELANKLENTIPQPVAWQRRTRLVDDACWTEWRDCSKESAESCWHSPVHHGWQREARALYAGPHHQLLVPFAESKWPEVPSPYKNDEYLGYSRTDVRNYARQVLAAHGIK